MAVLGVDLGAEYPESFHVIEYMTPRKRRNSCMSFMGFGLTQIVGSSVMVIALQAQTVNSCSFVAFPTAEDIVMILCGTRGEIPDASPATMLYYAYNSFSYYMYMAFFSFLRGNNLMGRPSEDGVESPNPE